MQHQDNAFRRIAPFLLLSGFVLYILLSGLVHYTPLLEGYLDFHLYEKHDDFIYETPDFSRFILSDTLDFPTNKKPGRVLVVGDIHGQFDSLQNLLAKLDYDPSPSSTDLLIHVGDILSKAAVSDNLQVLDWMATRDITGVRGNHDQFVIEWRGWQDWIRQNNKGRLWLDHLDSLWEDAHQKGTGPRHPAEWIRKQRHMARQDDKRWWKTLPKGWEKHMFGDHYLIASAMTKEHYDYLLSLPLVIHVPLYHTFIAHAGLLPSDPNRPPHSSRQPLAHVPVPPIAEQTTDRGTLRKWQEMALLSDIPQNQNPWVLLNLRSLRRDHTITRKSKKGTPWSSSWNDMMSRCSGYSNFIEPEGDAFSSYLPCLPSTVIYGHAAARGLDIKRWSFGLDTGCVYGRSLTAMVLESPTGSIVRNLDEDSIDDQYDYEDGSEDLDLLSSKRRLRFGDDGEHLANAYMVSVKCR